MALCPYGMISGLITAVAERRVFQRKATSGGKLSIIDVYRFRAWELNVHTWINFVAYKNSLAIGEICPAKKLAHLLADWQVFNLPRLTRKGGRNEKLSLICATIYFRN